MPLEQIFYKLLDFLVHTVGIPKFVAGAFCPQDRSAYRHSWSLCNLSEPRISAHKVDVWPKLREII